MREPTVAERFFMQVACVVLAAGSYLVWHEAVGLEQGLSAVIALAPLAVVSDKVRRNAEQDDD